MYVIVLLHAILCVGDAENWMAKAQVTEPKGDYSIPICFNKIY